MNMSRTVGWHVVANHVKIVPKSPFKALVFTQIDYGNIQLIGRDDFRVTNAFGLSRIGSFFQKEPERISRGRLDLFQRKPPSLRYQCLSHLVRACQTSHYWNIKSRKAERAPISRFKKNRKRRKHSFFVADLN